MWMRFVESMNASPNCSVNRRQFLQASAMTAGALAFAPQVSPASTEENNFSFVLLGDLHFDKPEHHDLSWLKANKAGDLNQIKNYSRITAEITPKLFESVRESVAQVNASFVLQVGDVVEGLCGSEELAARQDEEALAFVRDAKLGVPFLFTKGNHDVTGTGAPEAFNHVFAPFLANESAALRGGRDLASVNYAIELGGALFCFCDAYDPQNLEWLEATLAKRTSRHCFVVIHPPVVPYGARSNWILYAKAAEASKRDKLLGLLGKHNAFVIGGHIHKFSALTRRTPGGGKFVQLAVSSVINAPVANAKNQLSGVDDYNSDQVRVEPAFSPETVAERRAIYETERQSVTSFEYADMPGHSVVSVRGDEVKVSVFSGVSRQLWRSIELPKLLGS